MINRFEEYDLSLRVIWLYANIPDFSKLVCSFKVGNTTTELKSTSPNFVSSKPYFKWDTKELSFRFSDPTKHRLKIKCQMKNRKTTVHLGENTVDLDSLSLKALIEAENITSWDLNPSSSIQLRLDTGDQTISLNQIPIVIPEIREFKDSEFKIHRKFLSTTSALRTAVNKSRKEPVILKAKCEISSDWIRNIKNINSSGKKELVHVIGYTPHYIVLENFDFYTNLYDLFNHYKMILSLDQKMKIIRDVVLGLHELHSLNLLHNSLDPFHVFVTKDFSCKLGYFGKSQNQSNLSVGLRLGWIPPEVRGPNPAYTKSSDIHNLGLIIYSILINEIPTADNPSSDFNFPSDDQYFHVARVCLEYFPINRPTIQLVLSRVTRFIHLNILQPCKFDETLLALWDGRSNVPLNNKRQLDPNFTRNFIVSKLNKNLQKKDFGHSLGKAKINAVCTVDNDVLWCGCLDGSIIILRRLITDKFKHITTFQAHRESVTSLVTKKKYVISGSADRSICVWNHRKLMRLTSLAKQPKRFRCSKFVSPSSQINALLMIDNEDGFAIWSGDQTGYIYEFRDTVRSKQGAVEGSTKLHEIRNQSASTPINCFIQTNKNLVWIGCGDGTIRLVEHRKNVIRILQTEDKQVMAMTLVGDYIWACSNTYITIWCKESYEKRATLNQGAQAIASLATTRQVWTGYRDDQSYKIFIWDSESYQLLHIEEHRSNKMLLVPLGDWIVCPSWEALGYYVNNCENNTNVKTV